MDKIKIERTWLQGSPVQVDNLMGNAFVGEAGAHEFLISGKDNAGNVVPITGTITGKFLSSTMTTFALSGYVAEGVASVTLPSECYGAPGQFVVSIFATNGSTTTCIYCGVGSIFRTSTAAIAYPTTTLPDLTLLINQLDDVIASFPADLTHLLGAIAPTFVDNQPFTAGQYVWYNQVLYRFTADHPAGSWAGSADTVVAVIGTELNSTVRYTQQVLTDAQKTVARSNIDAADADDVTDLELTTVQVTPQTFDDNSKSQARSNIGAASSGDLSTLSGLVSQQGGYISDLSAAVGTVPTGETVEGQIGDLKSAIDELNNDIEYKTVHAKDYELTSIIDGFIAADPTRNQIRIDGTNAKTLFIPCFPNTAYIVSKQASARFRAGYTSEIPSHALSVYGLEDNASATTLTVSTGADAKYLVVFYYLGTVDTSTAAEILESINISGLFKKDVGNHLSDVANQPIGITIYAKDDNFVEVITGYIAADPTRNQFRTDVFNSRSLCVPCYPNTTYTITKKLSARYRIGYTTQFPEHAVSIYGLVDNQSATTLSVSTGDDAKYLVVFYYLGAYETESESEIFKSIEITGLFPTATDRYLRNALNLNLLNSIFYATPQQYGAKGDGVNDDTAAINECLAKNQFVVIPEGMYRITDTITPQIVNRSTVFCSDKAMFIADSTAFNSAIQSASTVSDRPSMLLLQKWVGWNQFGLTWFGGVFNCNNVEGLIGVKITNRVGFFADVPKLFVSNLGTNGVGILITGITSSAIKLGQIVIYGNDIIVSSNGNWTSSDSGTWKDAIGFYDIDSHDYTIDTLYIHSCLIGIYNDGGSIIHVNYYHYWAGGSSTNKFTQVAYEKTRAFYSTGGKWTFDYFYTDFAYIGAECDTICCGRTHFIGVNKDYVNGVSSSDVVGYMLKPTSGNGAYEFGTFTHQNFQQDCAFGGIILDGTSTSWVAMGIRHLLRFTPGGNARYHDFAKTAFGNFGGDSSTIEGTLSANTYYVLGYLLATASSNQFNLYSTSGNVIAKFDVCVTNTTNEVYIKNVNVLRQSGATHTLAIGTNTVTISGGTFYPLVIKSSASGYNILNIHAENSSIVISAGLLTPYTGSVIEEKTLIQS